MSTERSKKLENPHDKTNAELGKILEEELPGLSAIYFDIPLSLVVQVSIERMKNGFDLNKNEKGKEDISGS